MTRRGFILCRKSWAEHRTMSILTRAIIFGSSTQPFHGVLTRYGSFVCGIDRVGTARAARKTCTTPYRNMPVEFTCSTRLSFGDGGVQEFKRSTSLSTLNLEPFNHRT